MVVGVGRVSRAYAYAKPIRRFPGSDWTARDRNLFCLGDGLIRGWSEKTLRNDGSVGNVYVERYNTFTTNTHTNDAKALGTLMYFGVYTG